MGEFQKTIAELVVSEKLIPGNKYTLLYFGEFGQPIALKITLHSTQETTYAQYADAVRFIFRPFRKRTTYARTFCNCSLIIYDGWVDLDKNVGYNVEERNGITIRKSKYGCFDARWIDDCIEYLGEPILKYLHLQTREKDGKVFA